MQPIALITCSAHPQLAVDDRLLLAPLAAAGLSVEFLAWDEPGVDWARFSALVVRSPWDYFERPEAWKAWLGELDRQGVRVFNPAPVLRSNTDKRYLRQLESGGVKIPLTHWIEQGAQVNLAALKAQGGLGRYVVKPTISGGAAQTWISGAETEAGEQERLERVLRSSGAMLQAFLPEVETEGEWSLMFFGGRFSHAIKKLPAKGDFRVQSVHGGSVEALEPPAYVLEEAEAILGGLRKQLLYVRVDGIEINAEFVLLELELIEPELFFRCHPEAPQRFVDALVSMLQVGATP